MENRPGDKMKNGVAELISDRMDAMPAGERRAAQALIASYPVIGLKTVAEFSQAAGVSSPTILRFVARLGFQNYPEFQAALQDELAAQLAIAGFTRGPAAAFAPWRGSGDGRGDARKHPRNVPPCL